MIRSYRGIRPRIAASAYIDPSARYVDAAAAFQEEQP
jgi:hypothetical protein